MENGARNDAPRSTKPKAARTEVIAVIAAARHETETSTKLSARPADLAQVPLMQVSLRNCTYIHVRRRVYVRTSPLGPFAARQPADEGGRVQEGAERGLCNGGVVQPSRTVRRLRRRSTPPRAIEPRDRFVPPPTRGANLETAKRQRAPPFFSPSPVHTLFTSPLSFACLPASYIDFSTNIVTLSQTRRSLRVCLARLQYYIILTY